MPQQFPKVGAGHQGHRVGGPVQQARVRPGPFQPLGRLDLHGTVAQAVDMARVHHRPRAALPVVGHLRAPGDGVQQVGQFRRHHRLAVLFRDHHANVVCHQQGRFDLGLQPFQHVLFAFDFHQHDAVGRHGGHVQPGPDALAQHQFVDDAGRGHGAAQGVDHRRPDSFFALTARHQDSRPRICSPALASHGPSRRSTSSTLYATPVSPPHRTTCSAKSTWASDMDSDVLGFSSML